MIKFNEYFSLKSYQSSNTLIEEGGAYGHMANLYEDWERTFGELISIFKDSLRGKIEQVKEKTDGQALSISYRKGKVLFARNKGEYMNFGAAAMKGSADVEKRFDDHPNGNVRDAFIFAAKDLERAIKGMDDQDKKNFFSTIDETGKEVQASKWVNLEIIWPPSENVIPYNHTLLVLHNYREYNFDGEVVGGDFNEYAAQIEKRLQSTNAHVQDKFTISSMEMLTLPQVEDFGSQAEAIIQPLYSLMSTYSLTDQSRVGDYWVAYFRSLIDAQMQSTGYVNSVVASQLANHWAFRSLPKSKRPHDYDTVAGKIGDIKRQVVDAGFKKWITDTQRTHAVMFEQMIEPIKDMSITVGQQVINKMTKLLTLDPNKATRQIRQSMDETISKIRDTKDEELIAKLDKQLKYIAKAGGLESIVPTEGLTFTYQPPESNGVLPPQIVYKYTGVFGPVNQILGMIKYGR
jgi:hypothetical protein